MNIQNNYYHHSCTSPALYPQWDHPYKRQLKIQTQNNTVNPHDLNLQYHYASKVQLIYSPKHQNNNNTIVFSQKLKDFPQNHYIGYTQMKQNRNVYIPPHLNSSQSQKILRNTQCKHWNITNQKQFQNNIKKTYKSPQNHINNNNKKLTSTNKQFTSYKGKGRVNYEDQYKKMQNKIDKNGKKINPYKHSWGAVSKIKYLLDEDKQVHRVMTKPRKMRYLDMNIEQQ